MVINHDSVSYVKSVFRILAACALMGELFLLSGLLFIVAELLGIMEEVVE